MRILRASDYKRMPWKNGGGETVEIAVFPPGASVNDFDWRISMATVASDGPFSIFPGVDRTLSILNGNGMALAINGAEPVLLTVDSTPLEFAADIPVNATLVKGAIIDLNVMTRRGRFSHRVERLTGSFSISPDQQKQTVVIVPTKAVSIFSGDQNSALEPLDAMIMDAPMDVRSENVVCYVVRLNAA